MARYRKMGENIGKPVSAAPDAAIDNGATESYPKAIPAEQVGNAKGPKLMPEGRRCATAKCGTVLRRTNTGKYCGACERKQRLAWLAREASEYRSKPMGR